MTNTPVPDPGTMGTADMHRQDTPQRLDSTGTEVKNEDINTSQIVTSDDSLPITSQAHDGEAIGIDTAVPAESSAMDSQLQSYSDLPGFDDVRYDNDNDTNMTDAPEPDTSGSGKAAAAESNPYLMDSIVREITGAETVASADAITTENIQGSTPHDSVSEDLSLAEPPEAAITSTDTAPVTEMPPPPKFNLGASLFTRKKISAQNAMPKVAPALLNLDKLRAKRKKILDKYRTLGAAEKAHEASLLEDSSDSFSNGGMEIDPPAPAEVLDSEAEAFRKVEDEYSRKVRAGTVMQEEKIAFLQKEATELARLTKLKADAAYQSDSEQEEDDTASASDSVSALFVSETPAAKKKGRKRKSKELAEGDDGEDAGAIPSKAPAKKRSKASGRRKGFLDEEIEKVLTKVKSTQQARAAKKKADKAKADKAKADREKNKHDITNVASLHGTNVFKDAANNANLRSQPVFTKQKTRNKRNALAELIASIPSDDRRVAYGDKRLLEAALSDFTGKGSCFPCPDQDGQWKVKGMNYALKHYQVLGVAFMRRRESQLTEPRGGILADEMGLGKTIQMIANIINGKQLDKTSERKTTLIVASPALIQQWYNEIFKFARFKKGDEDGNDKDSHGLGSVIQHRAQHRLVGDEAKLIKTIKRSSICLTTYSEIQKSYPKAECPRELVTERQKSAWWKEFYAKEKGLFHKIEFHRIVLDEAQQIKNHKGHASMACRALTANHYWAISGTPLMNGVKEMYPYLKFIRYPHAGSMKLFLENFCSPDDPTGSEKLGVLLRQFVIRRTHADKLFEARLLDLPTPRQKVIYLEFNHVERILYEVVKKRFVQRINTMTRREGVQSQYSHIWSMLLRLRQICAHPLLIQDTILDLLEREDFERLNELTQETNVDSEETSSMLTHLKHMLTEHLRATFQDARPGHGQGQLEQLTVVPGGQFESEGREEDLGGKHGRNYQFQKYIKSLAGTKEWESINARKKCSSCRSDPYEAIITSCYHVYCRPCVEELQHNAARHNVDHAKCMQCGDEFQSIRVLEDPEVGGAEAVEREATPTGKNKTKGKKKSALDWIGMNGEILPSAKTIAAKAQILEWLSQSDDKIIVYTQFMPMIRIMGKVCDTEDWTYCKYTGEMSHTARENALRDFSDPEGDRQILLASLKSGGLGLNITAASRVIIMDPWWNDAIEQQAFCRVFRIGQEKETQLTRFCIKNTIDAAMFAVKERKMEEIERVMDQTKDNKFLNVAELMKLFGEVGEDEKGRPFIFPEHDDDAEDGIPPYIEPSDKSGGMFAQQDSDMGDEA